MLKFLQKMLAVVTVLGSLGFSAPLLADAGQFKLDMILAKRGDADAQYYVANAYEEGRGTDKDLNKALEWYSKAAKQNHHGAQYKLGVFYENGQGVKQDIKKGMEWYKQAAENGSTLAKERLNKAAFARSEEVMKRRIAAMKAEQEQREKQRKLAEQAAERKRQQAKARAKPKPKVATQQTRMATAAKPVMAKRVNIADIVDVIMKHKWRQGSKPADYLPSTSTNCLRASDSEIVCFSGEKQRVINGLRVTYTTKAVLSGFKSNGSFQVKYNYNAIKMAKASSRGVVVDSRGLKPEEGWQEPQLATSCQTTDRVNLYCTRGSVKFHYRR